MPLLHNIPWGKEIPTLRMSKMQGERNREKNMNNNAVDFLRKKGYPYKIKGNDGYIAYLVGIEPLADHDYAGIYRYPGGECVHFLEEIRECKTYEIIEQ